MRLLPLREFNRRLDLIEANRESLITIRSLIAHGDDTTSMNPDVAALLLTLEGTMGVVERRELDYSALIIQLYGAMENYVEALSREVATCLNESVKSYSDLPPRTQAGHRGVSLAALDAHEKSKYRGDSSFSEILAALSSCEENTDDYILNVECFSMHTANVRRDTINEMFSRLGFTDIASRVSNNPHVRALLTQYGRQPTDSFWAWDDLAVRRNIVAHGAVIESESLITLEGFTEYIDSIRCVGAALFDAALLDVINVNLPPYAQVLGEPFASYRSDHVLCFRPTNATEIEIESRVAWKRADGEWGSAVVIGLQVHKLAKDLHHGEPGQDFGTELSVGCRPTADGCFVVTK